MLRPLIAGALVAIACVSSLRAQQNAVFRFQRTVASEAPGAHRLPVDVALLRGASKFDRLERIQEPDGARWRAAGGLGDLRFFDSSGRAVPYLLVYAPTAEPVWTAAVSIQPLRQGKNTGFEADLGAMLTADMIRVEGIRAPFLKRLVLEGSGDRQRWTLLVPQGTLFDLPNERLKQLALQFPAGGYRYLRVTWNDANSGRVSMPVTVSARRADAATPGPSPLVTDVPFERRPSEPGRSHYRITLPAAGLPIVGLRVEVNDDRVFRPATVLQATLRGVEAEPAEIGRATLTRVRSDDSVAEDLRVPVSMPREAQIDLVVDDGSNAPLDVSRISAEFAELPWIYFEKPPGHLTARYGSPDAPAPRYDLEAVRPSLRILEVPPAQWGEASQDAATSPLPTGVHAPEPGPVVAEATFRFRRAVSGAAGLVAVPLDAAVLAHSRGPSGQFADLRLIDAAGRQLPYLIERLHEPLSVAVSIATMQPRAPELKSGTGRSRSVYAFDLPGEHLPAPALVLETSARIFTRTIRAGVERNPDRRHRDAWFEELSSAGWTHTESDGPAPALQLRLRPTDATRLALVVDEGDNSPLPITSARVLLPAYRVRFFHPGEGVRMVYGRTDLAPAKYDLSLLANVVLGAEAAEAALGAEASADGTSSGTGSFISPTVFWAALSLAALVLVGLIVRLMKRT